MSHPDPSAAPSRAVFLSYAHEDADAARRIAEALRGCGIEVWFDQNELRGGDAWDAKIRGQIRTCTLFVPIISAQTERRLEGYFRREWRLAVDRTHDMAESVPFLVPVVIDGTNQSGAHVPETFLRVQWTRLPGGEPTADFIRQTRTLINPGRPAAAREASPTPLSPAAPLIAQPGTRRPWPLVIGGLALVAAAIAWVALRPSTSAPAPSSAALVAPPSPTPTAKAVPAPSPAAAPVASAKSIAVLPFASMSEDKANDFFAEGIHEDVITNLAKIRDLKVISRTSVLAYRDTGTRNLRQIAAELGVANVLEGSVRRAGGKVRVTAQLINAGTDEHLWAETYDGEINDVFALQSKLSQAIATALKATLTAGERTQLEKRPTNNAAAYEYYLRARVLQEGVTIRSSRARYEEILAFYEKAAELDPQFALAHVGATHVNSLLFASARLDPTPERRALAIASLRRAEAAAPTAPETAVARAEVAYSVDRNPQAALAAIEAAYAGLPNDPTVLAMLCFVHRRLGHWQQALTYLERALTYSPNDLYNLTQATRYLLGLRRYEDCLRLSEQLVRQAPNDGFARETHARVRFALNGNREEHVREMAAVPPGDTDPDGLVLAYQVAVRRGDFAAADQALRDPRLGEAVALTTATATPVALLRANLAWAEGRKEDAKALGLTAIAVLDRRPAGLRKETFDLILRARAEAFAGRRDDAVRDGLRALEAIKLNDAYLSGDARTELARMYIVLGEIEAALQQLAETNSVPISTTSPPEWRLDPILSRLNNDPRFDAVIRSIKPL